jgi:hypothetical protein
MMGCPCVPPKNHPISFAFLDSWGNLGYTERRVKIFTWQERET